MSVENYKLQVPRYVIVSILLLTSSLLSLFLFSPADQHSKIEVNLLDFKVPQR
jgi:hypothetical protein